MSNFPNTVALPEGEQFHFTAAPRFALGTLGILPDGREFRYAKMGATLGAPGKLYQSEVPGANFDELVVPSAVAVGSRTVTVTNGATAITTDMFAGGYLNVEDDTGEGRLYKIKSNTADAGNGAVTITLAEGCSIQVALTTNTTVGLTKSPFADVIIHPSPPTAALAGVCVAAVTAANYCWLQVKGPSSLLGTGTLVIGKNCVPSVTVDGSVDPPALTEGGPNTGFDQPMVGRVMEVAATTEYSLVYLLLE
jgi:hypothetical protein